MVIQFLLDIFEGNRLLDELIIVWIISFGDFAHKGRRNGYAAVRMARESW